MSCESKPVSTDPDGASGGGTGKGGKGGGGRKASGKKLKVNSAGFLREPPTSGLVGRTTKERRNIFMHCFATRTLNAAVVDYRRWMHCGAGH